MIAIAALAGLGVSVLISVIIRRPKWGTILAGIGTAALMGFILTHQTVGGYSFVINGEFEFSMAMVTLLGLLITICAAAVSPLLDSRKADQIALLIFSTCGGLTLVTQTHFLMLFLGVEVLSIPLYILAASRRSESSVEAGIKYFIMGSFFSALLLFGMALVYAGTGTFSIHELLEILPLTGTHPLILSGLTLMVLGLAFKTGLVPFHFWVPDVYEGSPDVITGYMSTVAKLTAFVGLLKLFFVGYAIYGVVAKPLLVMVVASLILANLWGLSQQSTRRTLAYSGISHAGFLGIAMVTFAHNLGGAVYWYALSYALASLSAFYVLDQIGDYDMADIEGLLRRNRLLGVLLCVSLLSLAGIPPFAGFFGKMFVLIGAIGAGFFGLAILAVIASVVGAGYYVALIRKTTEATHHPILRLSTGASALAVVLLILQLIIIISPNFAILPILGGHYCGL